jgi:hypothetical protein
VADRRIHEAARAGYATAADVYARARPSYPAAAVDWLVEQLGLSRGDELVEIGAGTGKFTALLVERGFRSLPSNRSRQCDRGCVSAAMTSASSMPLPKRCRSRTIRLPLLSRPSHCTGPTSTGRLQSSTASSCRTAPSGWSGTSATSTSRGSATLDALLSEVRGNAPHSRDGRWQAALASSPFHVASSASWRWSVAGTPSDVVDRVRSVSYVAALPDAEQDRIDRRVIEILASHGPGDSRRVSFPYMTQVYALRRR